MNRAMIAVAAALLIVASAFYAGMRHERSDWELLAEQQKAKQEKHNADTINAFHLNLAALHDHYRRNPVRVRVVVPGEPRADCPAPRAEDIVLTVGGVARGDGAAVAR